ncbi:MAG: tRNA (adenosine(37)-N6)-dimethylallyltransferase MiaA [Bifidobacteriaceae bacterium]|jgi:tRNA dimethylallyltransferase|nr:tRNA (adenosine(37)-N6)-dimethylallyltransferase MiaA [Bifidobacteriaceae bacterium]
MVQIDKSTLIAIVGPTASGKTGLAIKIAESISAGVSGDLLGAGFSGASRDLLGAEIINADSYSLYKYMDIGTAKPSIAERGAVPHHQIDVLEPTEIANVAVYQKKARADIKAIFDRGNIPILVGGSSLYIRAVLDEVDFPPVDLEVRGQLEQIASDGDYVDSNGELILSGTAALYSELSALDPESAANILPTNTRRIIRALEVVRITGKPFKSNFAPQTYHNINTVQYMPDISYDRDELDKRIRIRTDSMRELGLTEEVSSLYERDLLGVTASKAIGYAELIKHFDSPLTYTLDQAYEDIFIHTRRLVRKQLAWFLKDPRIKTISD